MTISVSSLSLPPSHLELSLKFLKFKYKILKIYYNKFIYYNTFIEMCYHADSLLMQLTKASVTGQILHDAQI